MFTNVSLASTRLLLFTLQNCNRVAVPPQGGAKAAEPEQTLPVLVTTQRTNELSRAVLKSFRERKRLEHKKRRRHFDVL